MERLPDVSVIIATYNRLGSLRRTLNSLARQTYPTDGFEVIECPLPCLITITNEFGEPRYAPLKGIMKAAKIQPTIWKPQDIGIDPSQIGASGRHAKLVKLFQPVKEGKCEIVEGENVVDAAVNLAVKLREAKVL